MEMREPTYFLLAGLLDGPRHGYAIAQLARELSGGRVGLSAGTLYGALERLSDQGLITAVGELRVGGRRRRVYELTEEGRAQLVEEAERLRQAADVVTARLLATSAGQAEIDRVAAEVARRTEERLASRPPHDR
jgi:PadR family transcriptional regulator, regulatory protein PadR